MRKKMMTYKLTIPAELYQRLNEGKLNVKTRLQRGIKWVLLEYMVRSRGGAIIIEHDGHRVRVVNG